MNDSEIRTQIENELDKAEKLWNEVKDNFIFEKAEVRAMSESNIPSKIPGHEKIKIGKPEVGDFIALVLDIRKSTEHLLMAISPDKAKASQLERVLYETTAINTAGLIIIKQHKGGVTELLGDGFLALFKNNNIDSSFLYNAHAAAQRCLYVTQNIINTVLKERYNLPPLNIGIGLAYSKAIVTAMGTEGDYHPKAIGECIYRASKLSDGFNEIYIDEKLKNIWPKTKGGTLRFLALSGGIRLVSGYKISKS